METFHLHGRIKIIAAYFGVWFNLDVDIDLKFTVMTNVTVSKCYINFVLP